MVDHPRTLRTTDRGAEAPPAPIYAVWEITLRCDQPCAHCGSRAGASRARELSTDEIFQVAERLAALGCREVVLIGGEAYLRRDLPKIIEHLVALGVRVLLQTGGRAFTRERAASLAAAGLAQVGVSIDGPARIHDRLRGNLGSHAAAMHAIDAAREVGLIASVNSQINRLNMDHLEPMFEAFYERGVRAWQVQLTAPMGRAADHPDWIVEPFHVPRILDTLAALQERAAERFQQAEPGDRMFDVFCGNNLGYFGPHETLLRSRPGGDESHFQGCKAGIHSIGIESDGVVKGCPSLPTAPYAGKSVLDVPLDEIWASSEVRFQRGHEAGELWGFCAGCHFARVCGAGCAFTAHSTLGRRGNYPFCYHRVKTLEKDGVRERLIHRERAPDRPYDFGRFDIVVEPIPEAE